MLESGLRDTRTTYNLQLTSHIIINTNKYQAGELDEA